MTKIMPVPRNLILLSYQQGAFAGFCFFFREVYSIFKNIAAFNDKIPSVLSFE